MGFQKFKRPIDMRTGGDPDFRFDTCQQTIVPSTAASTSLGPRGAFALNTTSTGTPVVYTLAAPTCGDRLSLMADSLASSSDAPFHINTGGPTVGASSADMISLSTVGAGISLIAVSTSRWLVDGAFNAAVSTST